METYTSSGAPSLMFVVYLFFSWLILNLKNMLKLIMNMQTNMYIVLTDLGSSQTFVTNMPCCPSLCWLDLCICFYLLFAAGSHYAGFDEAVSSYIIIIILSIIFLSIIFLFVFVLFLFVP